MMGSWMKSLIVCVVLACLLMYQASASDTDAETPAEGAADTVDAANKTTANTTSAPESSGQNAVSSMVYVASALFGWLVLYTS